MLRTLLHSRGFVPSFYFSCAAHALTIWNYIIQAQKEVVQMQADIDKLQQQVKDIQAALNQRQSAAAAPETAKQNISINCSFLIAIIQVAL